MIGGATTFLLDADSKELVGFGTATSIGEPLVQVSTRTATAKPAPTKLTAVTFYHTQPAPNQPARFGVIRRTALTAADGLDVKVTDPVKHVSSNPTQVVIALCRDPQHPNPDADYVYPSATNVDPDRLVVPFTGTATLPYPIDTSQPLSLTSKLYSKATQGWIALLNQGQLLPGVSSSGNTITWNYPFDNVPIPQTRSLQYAFVAQTDDTETDFVYQFVIPVKAPIQTYQFTVCSTDTPDEPSLQCVKILDLQYWWHCVAADTKVTLENGDTLTIDQISNLHRVRTGLGASLAVEATSRSRHSRDSADRAQRLETTCGRTVVVSTRHPVITPGGPVPACDLGPGDAIVTEGGLSTVKRREPIDYDGLMCNLKLVDSDDRRRGLQAGWGSFLANGIAVGDHVTLARHQAALRVDPDYQLARLPTDYHRDFLSALADRTR
jgi:hypothetical protein